jgi:hypothetical protein
MAVSMTAVALVYSGLVIGLFGFICLLKPLAFLKIRSRASGVLFLVAGVSLAVGGFILPSREFRVADPRTRLDEFAPNYQFHEVHSIYVNASAERVFGAIKQVTPNEIAFFQTLTWIRRGGRPAPPGILHAPDHQSLIDIATRTSFLLLAKEPDREIVLGSAVLVPPGWQPTTRPTGDDFKKLHAPGFALASMNFIVEPEAPNRCRVTTETRVYATDAASTRKFARYWRVIYPGSALIRRMWLRAIKKRAESQSVTASPVAGGDSDTM